MKPAHPLKLRQAAARFVAYGLLGLAPITCTSIWTSATAAATPLPQARLEQGAQRDIARFLELDAPQQQALKAQRDAFAQQWEPLLARAQALQKIGAAPSAPSDEHKLLCDQAQALQASHRAQLRSRLSPLQLERLAQLENAFLLMPLVEAAQATGLMAPHLHLAPAGLPNGHVTVATTWQRVLAPPALPGCNNTRVVREVELKGSGELKRPPLR